MRRSQQFRPDCLVTLEDRVVLSHVSLTAHHAAKKPTVQVAPLNSTTPTAEGPTMGSIGDFHGQTMAQTIAAGKPVYEELTTNYDNSTTQGESRLVVPNLSAGSVTTTKNFTLRNNAGLEQVVDVATTKGTTTTHNITTILPNGATETSVETDVLSGGKSYLKGTTTLPGGSLNTYTGTVTSSGNKTTTDKTVVDPEGFSTQYNTVVTLKSELSLSTVTKVTFPDGTTTTSNSNTNIFRLQPPGTS